MGSSLSPHKAIRANTSSESPLRDQGSPGPVLLASAFRTKNRTIILLCIHNWLRGVTNET